MAKVLKTDVHTSKDGRRVVLKKGTRHQRWMDAVIGDHCFEETKPVVEVDEEPEFSLDTATIEELEAWVGTDADRAAEALEHELGAKKRTGAIEFLNGVLGG